jgi:hypothetical protein
MMKGVHFLAIVALLSLASSLVSAFDPRPLQDICVAIDDPKSAGIYIYYNYVYYFLLTSITVIIGFLLIVYACNLLFPAVFVNGKFCKDLKYAKAEDFFFFEL